jgi:hypothetical protein
VVAEDVRQNITTLVMGQGRAVEVVRKLVNQEA